MKLRLACTCLLLAAAALAPSCAPMEREEPDLAGDVSGRLALPVTLGSILQAEPADWVRRKLESEIDEDDAVRIALLNNPEVAEQFARLGIARADFVQAGLLRNPVFEGNAKFFGSGTEVELALAQPFLDLFALPRRAKAAEARLLARRAEVTRGLVELAFRVRRAVVEVRAAQELSRLRRLALDASMASTDLMGRLHDAGNVQDRQLTAEEAMESADRLDLAAAESRTFEARERLNVLLGAWGAGVHWRLAPATGDLPPPPDLEHVETRAVRASLDLAQARAEIDAAAQQAGLAGWEQVFAEAEVGVAAKREAADGWGEGPAARFPVPIFDTGSAREARASAVLRERLARFAGVAVLIRAGARALRERVQGSRERALYVSAVLVPLKSRLKRETLRNFNAMQVGVFDVLQARREEVETLRLQVESKRDAWLEALDLAELLAGSVHGDVIGGRRDDRDPVPVERRAR